jgi:hypothetical protein
MVNKWATLKFFLAMVMCIVKNEIFEVKLKMGSNFEGKVYLIQIKNMSHFN